MGAPLPSCPVDISVCLCSCIYEHISILEREHQESLGPKGQLDKQARMITVVDMGGISANNLNKVSARGLLVAL